MSNEFIRADCHYLKRIRAGDEIGYWCELSDHPCAVEYEGAECEEQENKEEENGKPE